MSAAISVQSWLDHIDPLPYTESTWNGETNSQLEKRKRTHDGSLRPRRPSWRPAPLSALNSNIMPLPNGQKHSQLPISYDKHQPGGTSASILSTPQDRRKRQRKRSDVQEGGSSIEIYEDEGNTRIRAATSNPADETPRPQKRPTLDMSIGTMLPYTQTRQELSPSSPSRASASDAPSSTRSRSPIKKTVDLQLAEVPTHFRDLDGRLAERLGGVLNFRYKRLAEINRGGSIIPRQLRASIESLLHEDDRPASYNYTLLDTVDPDERSYQVTWPHQLSAISEQAKEYARESHSEAAWNGDVHGPIIRLVTKMPKYRGSVTSINITAARLEPKSLSPVHIAKGEMQGKMVDYAVCLVPPQRIEERINTTIAKFPKDAQSVNQTLYEPLRHKPIAFNIETKKPFTGGQDADVQLSVWAGAGLLKMGQLMDKQNRHRVEIPTTPVLTLHGYDLYMSVLKREDTCNKIYGQLYLGSVRTLLGGFQIVAALDLLVDWANTDYRTWLEAVFE